MSERRNDLEITIESPQIALQIPNSDRSPLYDVRNPARASVKTACEGMFRGRRSGSKASAIKPSGGARRDRPDDLMLAKHALSQLSYGPVPEDECLRRLLRRPSIERKR